jgi:hypothetical protein
MSMIGEKQGHKLAHLKMTAEHQIIEWRYINCLTAPSKARVSAAGPAGREL